MSKRWSWAFYRVFYICLWAAVLELAKESGLEGHQPFTFVAYSSLVALAAAFIVQAWEE